jgi:hypothetical protein
MITLCCLGSIDYLWNKSKKLELSKAQVCCSLDVPRNPLTFKQKSLVQSHYSDIKKYCRRCEFYFIMPRVFYECCGMRLRAYPHCGRVYMIQLSSEEKLQEDSILGFSLNTSFSLIATLWH